jgi:hypothetical protein
MPLFERLVSGDPVAVGAVIVGTVIGVRLLHGMLAPASGLVNVGSEDGAESKLKVVRLSYLDAKSVVRTIYPRSPQSTSPPRTYSTPLAHAHTFSSLSVGYPMVRMTRKCHSPCRNSGRSQLAGCWMQGSRASVRGVRESCLDSTATHSPLPPHRLVRTT